MGFTNGGVERQATLLFQLKDGRASPLLEFGMWRNGETSIKSLRDHHD
jgi:hypothetical protein